MLQNESSDFCNIEDSALHRVLLGSHIHTLSRCLNAYLLAKMKERYHSGATLSIQMRVNQHEFMRKSGERRLFGAP